MKSLILNQNLSTVLPAEPEHEIGNEDINIQARDTVNMESIDEQDTAELTDRHLPEETILDSMDAMQYIPELDPSDAIRIAPGNKILFHKSIQIIQVVIYIYR